MIVFLRFIVCFAFLITASAAYADDALLQSEQQLQAAYDAAVKQVNEQKPTSLGALQNEQDDWRDLRDKECKEANANLPKKYDQQAAINFCKANMNHKRTNTLLGKRPNGKDW